MGCSADCDFCFHSLRVDLYVKVVQCSRKWSVCLNVQEHSMLSFLFTSILVEFVNVNVIIN